MFLFLIQAEVLEGAETQMSKMSKINLIDLAGSERASSALNDEVIDSKETYDLRLKVGLFPQSWYVRVSRTLGPMYLLIKIHQLVLMGSLSLNLYIQSVLQ